jgi:hypothetical protein
MAIQIDLPTSQYGIPFSGAYFRIVTATVSRQRQGGAKFNVMLDVAGYGTSRPGDDTREVAFRRYHAPLEDIESQQGAAFLDKCYAWVMAQPDMAASVAV